MLTKALTASEEDYAKVAAEVALDPLLQQANVTVVSTSSIPPAFISVESMQR